MRTVKSLTDRIESKFPIGHSTDTHLSVTGEPYVTIGHPTARHEWEERGIVSEGEEHDGIGFDEETACWAALSAWELYSEERKGMLYWREKPWLEWGTIDGKPRCVVRMRLLVSDNMVGHKQR